jgi:hypothetical protein
MKTIGAIILLISATLILAFANGQQSGVQNIRATDAYKLGWIEGRMEATIEGFAIHAFHTCIENAPQKSAQACWDEQITSAQKFFTDWDKSSDQEKIKYGETHEMHRWINNLRGKGDQTDLPRFLR